jgi:hypothetical protein|tara:strand:+ start:549 stop:746 length:198 start_codon:yes stop_codon:yes gene_type:complete
MQATTYEEDYFDFHIYIEPNPDNYNEGFTWSICKDEIEWESNLEFSIEDALKAAKKAIERNTILG